MRSIPADFDVATVEAIDARLETITNDDRVAMPLAIESGSRAWGFASPDSDYDCRFLFVRRRQDYLTLWPQRDVIETPLDGLLDVNGWDVAKALRLIVKGNAVAIEWLRSPIVYRGDPAFRDTLSAFADAHAPLALIRRHYLHLGMQQRDRANEGEGIAIKRLFYILRPAAVLRWMRHHPGATPPMHFPTLIAECDPPPQVRAIIADLIARKAETRELGLAPMPAEIETFVQAEYAIVEAEPKSMVDARSHAAADAAFHEMLERFAPR
ncbi:MAG: nucleotidyltransferase domain-containing protein [Pseudomonadota bacterium]|jgi:predicted nucleotidyltransferase|uniref:Nucleotidyltransferase n=1 Tax=hydrothermal vent metagenome TaxID=652676 RepID=A0A160TKM3_9ZZZZ